MKGQKPMFAVVGKVAHPWKGFPMADFAAFAATGQAW
jgi:hypothetical protein